MYINKSFFKYYTIALFLLSVFFFYTKVSTSPDMAKKISEIEKHEAILSSDIKYIYNLNSKYVIIEYSDLNCIHCKNLNELIEKNKDKLNNISIYKRNLAYISNGESAIKTLYGNCLRKQTDDNVWLAYEKLVFTKFEDRYHDKIFLDIAKSLIKDTKIKDIKNIKTFESCIEDKNEINKALKDREIAIVNGIRYIPTILVIKDNVLVKKIDGYTAPGMYSFIEFYNK